MCHALGINTELFSVIGIHLVNAVTETWSAGNGKTRVTSLVKNLIITLSNLSLIEGTLSVWQSTCGLGLKWFSESSKLSRKIPVDLRLL